MMYTEKRKWLCRYLREIIKMVMENILLISGLVAILRFPIMPMYFTPIKTFLLNPMGSDSSVSNLIFGALIFIPWCYFITKGTINVTSGALKAIYRGAVVMEGYVHEILPKGAYVISKEPFRSEKKQRILLCKQDISPSGFSPRYN